MFKIVLFFVFFFNVCSNVSDLELRLYSELERDQFSSHLTNRFFDSNEFRAPILNVSLQIEFDVTMLRYLITCMKRSNDDAYVVSR